MHFASIFFRANVTSSISYIDEIDKNASLFLGANINSSINYTNVRLMVASINTDAIKGNTINLNDANKTNYICTMFQKQTSVLANAHFNFKIKCKC
jgi:hypothetical protein